MSDLPIQIEASKLGEGYPPKRSSNWSSSMETAAELAAARAEVKAIQKRREVEVVRAVDVYGLDHSRVATASGFTYSRVGQILIEAG